MALLAERVLVHRDGLGIREDRDDFGAHFAHVVSGDERRGEDAPEAEMRARLGEREAVVADFHHVRVVPMTRAGVLLQAVDAFLETHLEIEDDLPAHRPFLDTVVAIDNVAGRAPKMADVLRPFPRLGGAPFAHAKHDRPAGGVERVAHRGVGLDGVAGAGATPIVFQIIDAPLRVAARVLIFVALIARIAGTGELAGVAVDAELEAARAQIVGKRLKPAGKLVRIGYEIALRIALARHPAVVEIDIIVAGVAHAVLDHRFGDALDELLVDMGGEGVPGIPAHRRSLGEALELLGRRARGKEEARRANGESCSRS